LQLDTLEVNELLLSKKLFPLENHAGIYINIADVKKEMLLQSGSLNNVFYPSKPHL
jgi:hypothetical protein